MGQHMQRAFTKRNTKVFSTLLDMLSSSLSVSIKSLIFYEFALALRAYYSSSDEEEGKQESDVLSSSIEIIFFSSELRLSTISEH